MDRQGSVLLRYGIQGRTHVYMSDVDCSEQAIFGQEVSVGFADHFFNLLDFLTTHAEVIKPAVFPQHLVNWA